MKWKLQEDIITDEVGEELVLTLPNGNMVVLNLSAAAVYEAICSHDDFPNVQMEDGDLQVVAAKALQDNFEIEAGIASCDADKAIRQLKSARVVVPVYEPIRTKSPYRRVTRRAFVAGMAAAGLSLLGEGTALGEESSKVAEQAYAGADLGTVDEAQGVRTWTDTLGNSVEVPLSIDRVSPYGPYAQALLESIDPSLVVQTTMRGAHASVKASTAASCEQINQDVIGEAAISVDALEETAPDLILDIAVSEEMLCTTVDKTANEAGVPIAHLVIGVGELPQAYRALGKLLDREDRCNELADYVASIDVALAQLREGIAEEDRKRVYIGVGDNALTACDAETLLGKCLVAAGGRNVCGEAAVEPELKFTLGKVAASSPDFVVLAVCESDSIRNTWFETGFDKTTEILLPPTSPDLWLGNSPFLSQTIGSLWLANKICERAEIDIEKEINCFFKIVYGCIPESSLVTGADVAVPSLLSQKNAKRTKKVLMPGVELISSERLTGSTAMLVSEGGSGGVIGSNFINSCLLSSSSSIYGAAGLQTHHGRMEVQLSDIVHGAGSDKGGYRVSIVCGCKSVDSSGNQIYDLNSASVIALLSDSSGAVFDESISGVPFKCASYPAASHASAFLGGFTTVTTAIVKELVSSLNTVTAAFVFAADVLEEMSGLSSDQDGNYFSASYQERRFEYGVPAPAQMVQHVLLDIAAPLTEPVVFEIRYYVPSTVATADLVISKKYRLYQGELTMCRY